MVDKVSKKGYGRNYWALAIEGAFFMGGISLLSINGTVALFINSMTGSNTLIGLAVTINLLCMGISQFFSAPCVRSVRRLPEFIFKTLSFQRSLPIFMAIPLFLGAGRNVSVGVFMALFGLFFFLGGFNMIFFGELVARSLRPELRGHMHGMQITVGSILSLMTGLLLTWLLGTPLLTDYHRFATIFVLAGAIFLISLFFLRMVRDPNPIEKPEKIDFRKYYAKIPDIIRKSKYLRRVLIARIPAFIGFTSITFIIVFGARTLSLSDSQTSWLVYANIIGGLLGGISMGELSKRLGNRTVIIFCNAAVLVALSMAIALYYVPTLGYAWLFAICILAGLAMNNWLGYFTYFMDIAPDKERSVYLVVGNGIGIPFSFAGYALGAIVDGFGYVVMFVVCGIFAIIAIAFSIPLLSKSQVRVLNLERQK